MHNRTVRILFVIALIVTVAPLALAVEFVRVTYPTSRQVYVDATPCGFTNDVLQLQTGYHTFDLGDPQNYTPSSHLVNVRLTLPTDPMVIEFTPAADPPPGDGDQCGGFDWVSGCSPIVINFEHGGYRLTGADSPVLFDMSGAGHPALMGWTVAGADEGFLWLDRNHDGRVTNGVELFGNHSILRTGRRAANGFEALRELDDNHDGVIDADDGGWAELSVWRDLNHDGLSQAGEISSLAENGVVAIDLGYHWTGRRDAAGNAFRYEAKIWERSAAGQVRPRPVYDIYFAVVTP